jgi:hypothetical protein
MDDRSGFFVRLYRIYAVYIKFLKEGVLQPLFLDFAKTYHCLILTILHNLMWKEVQIAEGLPGKTGTKFLPAGRDQ